jgi:predicted aspartyl protease
MSWLGRVTVKVKVFGAAGKELEREALVDTGSETLGLPADVARALDLGHDGYRNVTSAMGPGRAPWIRELRIEVLGATVTTDAVVTPEGTPILLGCKQLEVLDLTLHPKRGLFR